MADWVELRWSRVDRPSVYRLQLATDPELKVSLLSRLSLGNELHLPLPPPGRYYVRVDALATADDGERRSKVYDLEIPAPGSR